jgi:hypothetical protein
MKAPKRIKEQGPAEVNKRTKKATRGRPPKQATRGRPTAEAMLPDEILQLPLVFLRPLEDGETFVECSRAEIGMPDDQFDLVKSAMDGEITQDLPDTKSESQFKCYFRSSTPHEKCFRMAVLRRVKANWFENRVKTATCKTCVGKGAPCWFFNPVNRKILVLPQLDATDWTLASSWLPPKSDD